MAGTANRTVARRAAQARFVVLTGLSGAGKSQAIRALEDLGYFCVDNLPSTLIPTMAELASRAGSGLEKVALVVDVRERAFLSQFPRVFRRIRRMPGLKPLLIFLEARDAALVRRFSETRRPASAREAPPGARGDSRGAKEPEGDPGAGGRDHRHLGPDRLRPARRVHGGRPRHVCARGRCR